MESDECYTPGEYIQRARDVLGRIDVDPASNEAAQRIINARRFYTAERDGLAKRVRWRGRVWLNPPYSYPDPFVEKLIREYDAGFTTAAIALLNARTGSAWFQSLARRAWRCEKRKRIRFYGPGTAGKSGSGFVDNVFLYLGAEPMRFAAAFAELGEIVPPSVTISVTEAGVCVACGRSLAGHRRGALTCSPRCRQRRHRAA